MNDLNIISLENVSGLSNIGSIKIPILSAKKIFFTKPTVNKINPNLIFSFLNMHLFLS